MWVRASWLVNVLWEEVGCMGTSGNKDIQLAPRSTLKDLIDDTLPISAGSLLHESVLATAGITFLLVEPCAGCVGED